MICPKCESEKMNIISTSFPKTIECTLCNYIFVEGKKPLVDE